MPPKKWPGPWYDLRTRRLFWDTKLGRIVAVIIIMAVYTIAVFLNQPS